MPAQSGTSGPTTTRSTFFSLAKSDHRRVVGDVERHAFGLLRDAGIAGRAIELVGERAGRHFPGQRVLASAGAENEDVHGTRRAAFRGWSPFGVAWCLALARDSTRMAEPALNNVVEWTVSELSSALRRTVEDAYGYVRVRGEVSGFKGASPSGHVYFRLKDDKAVLEAVIWKGTFGRMRVRPEEGLDVIVSGKLTTFAGSSKYQIVIDSLEPAGIGALMKLLEERKKKLAAEGLFDEARKQLLPFLPEVIGVVTSPTGAVIRDILHRLARPVSRAACWCGRCACRARRRRPRSPPPFMASMRCPKRGPLPRPDLIIVARGGGSLEDLWSFNEEIVVRAAAASMIPLISAVGHETDVTLIDFAADRRAPTPTAAAEMAVPVRAELMTALAESRLPQARLLAAQCRPAPQGAAPARRARCRRSTICSRCRASGSMPAPGGCRARCAPMRRSTIRN